MRLGLFMMLFGATATAAAGPAVDDFAAGLAALAMRDFVAAEQSFRAVIAADPRSHEAYNNLAVAEAEQGREEDAAAVLRQALAVRPEYDRARQNLAAIYVRLAAKELLVAAERADGSKRQALAATARELLNTGPQVASSELLARADSLAASPPVRSPSATPVPARNTAAPPSLTPTQTQVIAPTPSDTATVKPAPIPTATASSASALESLRVGIEPIGTALLVIDLARQRAVLYRRGASGLVTPGEWPVESHGQVTAALLSITRRSDWSMRLFDVAARGAAGWAIESASKATKSAAGVVLSATAFRSATKGLVPGRDVVLVAQDAARVVLDNAPAAELRQRLEMWRAAWERADVDAYAAVYAADFVDERQRPRASWQARKQDLFRRSGPMTVRLHNVTIIAAGEVGVSLFEQEYQSALERSRERKQLVWRRRGGTWTIMDEATVKSERPAATGE